MKDLVTNWQGICSGRNSFSTIHEDLVTEHFKKIKKTRKEQLGLSSQVIVLTFIYAVCKWIKSTPIHSKVRTMLWKKLNVFTSQVHKEMAPGNKRWRFEHARSLKANLNIMSTFLETVQLEISQLVEKLIMKLFMVFCMYRRPGLLSTACKWRVKNHSLTQFAKQD